MACGAGGLLQTDEAAVGMWALPLGSHVDAFFFVGTEPAYDCREGNKVQKDAEDC